MVFSRIGSHDYSFLAHLSNLLVWEVEKESEQEGNAQLRKTEIHCGRWLWYRGKPAQMNEYMGHGVCDKAASVSPSSESGQTRM